MTTASPVLVLLPSSSP